MSFPISRSLKPALQIGVYDTVFIPPFVGPLTVMTVEQISQASILLFVVNLDGREFPVTVSSSQYVVYAILEASEAP